MPPIGLTLVAALLSAVVALVSCAPRETGPPATARVRPPPAAGPGALRVLFLTGGGYHDFAGNPAALMQGLAAGGADGSPFAFTVLALGPDDPDAAAHRASLETLQWPGSCDVLLAYTQGDLGLSPAARERLLAFVAGGGGFVGLHCAADSHPGWDEYDRMLGGRFEKHPPFGPVTVRIDVPDHPVTARLQPEWTLPDEFYHLKEYPAADKQVLMTGVSPEGGERRPVTWVRTWGRGRVVYTILGHGPETHRDPRFQGLVAQALAWAGGGAAPH